jgi:outer membrane protein OmpA-like peptidoglycan-associated protein
MQARSRIPKRSSSNARKAGASRSSTLKKSSLSSSLVKASRQNPAHLSTLNLLALQRALGNLSTRDVVSQIQRQAEKGSQAAASETAASGAKRITLYFDQNNPQPKAGELGKLDKYLLMAKDPQCQVRLEGHTSLEGSQGYNQALSERRNSSVEAYLMVMGVDLGRIKSKGYGEKRPAAAEKGVAAKGLEAVRSKNRRVEIILSGQSRESRDYQAWLNRTAERFNQILEKDQKRLEKAKERLAKIERIKGKGNPMILLDAQYEVIYWENGVKKSTQMLQKLEEARTDVEKFKRIVLEKKSVFDRWIKNREESIKNNLNLLMDAQQSLRKAVTDQEKAFWKWYIEEVQFTIKDLQEDVKYLKKQKMEA